MAAAHFWVIDSNSSLLVELGVSIKFPILTVRGTARGTEEPFCKIFSEPHKHTGNIGAFALAASRAAPLLGH